MAATAQGEALTASVRQAQARNAALTAIIVARSFNLVDVNDTSTWERWLALVLPYIVRGRRQSALLSATYLTAFRALEHGLADPITFPTPPDPPEQMLRTSLSVVGLQKFRTKTRDLDLATTDGQALLARAREEAAAGAAAAAIRHVQNGGREAVIEGVKADRAALGYVRVTRDNACYFCAMLASRGPVYKDDSFSESDPRFTGFGDVKVHDSCGCSLEPVYTRSGKLPGRSDFFSELWASSTRGQSMGDAINAFRRAYEGRSRT